MATPRPEGAKNEECAMKQAWMLMVLAILLVGCTPSERVPPTVQPMVPPTVQPIARPQFKHATRGQWWRIYDENVAVINEPRAPGSKTEFLTMVVTIVKPTDTMVIIGEGDWYMKQVALYWPGDSQPYATGWIIGDSVEQAECVFGLE